MVVVHVSSQWVPSPTPGPQCRQSPNTAPNPASVSCGPWYSEDRMPPFSVNMLQLWSLFRSCSFHQNQELTFSDVTKKPTRAWNSWKVIKWFEDFGQRHPSKSGHRQTQQSRNQISSIIGQPLDLNINIWKYSEIQYSEIYVNKWLYTTYKSKLINQQLWH